MHLKDFRAMRLQSVVKDRAVDDDGSGESRHIAVKCNCVKGGFKSLLEGSEEVRRV